MRSVWLLLFCYWFQIGCGQATGDVSQTVLHLQLKNMMSDSSQTIDTATLAAGCFWCVEAQFAALDGVQSVKSGYAGGHTEHPTYEEVCRGTTGHAEVVQFVYNPQVIRYDELLAAFFLAHDPTQLNRQGNDIGTQYRSAIFPHNDEQELLAREYIQQLNDKDVYGKKVVTSIEPLTNFYPAEDYHDNYFINNPGNPYCQMVVRPKVEKFKEVFKDRLK